MKRLASLAVMLALTSGLSLAAEFVGWVTDQNCATSGNYTGAQHKKCVESGQPVVFVSDADKKVYKIQGEKVKEMVGRKVTLQGNLKGDLIEAESITAIAD